jgi:hypothetical protein
MRTPLTISIANAEFLSLNRCPVNTERPPVPKPGGTLGAENRPPSGPGTQSSEAGSTDGIEQHEGGFHDDERADLRNGSTTPSEGRRCVTVFSHLTDSSQIVRPRVLGAGSEVICGTQGSDAVKAGLSVVR